jgi:hypothetical protein
MGLGIFAALVRNGYGARQMRIPESGRIQGVAARVGTSQRHGLSLLPGATTMLANAPG